MTSKGWKAADHELWSRKKSASIPDETHEVSFALVSG